MLLSRFAAILLLSHSAKDASPLLGASCGQSYGQDQRI